MIYKTSGKEPEIWRKVGIWVPESDQSANMTSMARTLRMFRIWIGYILLDIALLVFPGHYRRTLERCIDELLEFRYEVSK